ncbi:MAG: hypothetical protein ACHQ2E_03395 [Gemmatimonadales bacterium]
MTTVPSPILRRVIALFSLPPALLGLLFGLRILKPEIMASWCTTRRGCGGVKLWLVYPTYFPAIALSFGIAFVALSILMLRGASVPASRWSDLGQRLAGLGVFFGFATALYWIGMLGLTDGQPSRLVFDLPLVVLVVIVVPTEIARFRAGKRFDED